MKPQIVTENWSGFHNSTDSEERLKQMRTYQDLSTVCIIPTRGQISAKVVQCWMNLMPPMNQKFMRMFVIGMEVGDAYNAAIEQILAHPELSQWKYIFTLEDDNMPPPDALIKLYEGMKDFDVVGGLYWTKGEMGQPMIYGDPSSITPNFIPQIPIPDTLQHCRGLGMGCNLFKMEIFKDNRIPKPWFKTLQEFTEGVGARTYTQDLYFFENAGREGFRFACDTRIKVGHYDASADLVW